MLPILHTLRPQTIEVDVSYRKSEIVEGLQPYCVKKLVVRSENLKWALSFITPSIELEIRKFPNYGFDFSLETIKAIESLPIMRL